MSGWLVRHHRAILAVLAVVTIGAVALLLGPGLRYDYRLEAFVASDDESYRTYRHFMDEFTSNEVAIIAVRTDDALSPASTRLMNDLIGRLQLLPAVQKVQALAGIPPMVRRLVGDRLAGHRLVRDNLLSSDGRTAAILLQMRGEGQSSADRHQTVARLRSIVARAQRDYPNAGIIIAGPYVTLIDMYNYVDRDLLVFSVAAFALLGVTLWLVFRRPGPMVFALGVGASATLCALGAAILFDFSATLITQMIVILVMVLSVASCVHLAVASEETAAAEAVSSPRELAHRTLRRMLAPCTAVVATTAAGFGSVCISNITPVRIFGLLMVCGLVVSLPAALAGSVRLTGRPRARRATGGVQLSTLLIRAVRWAGNRRVTVVLLFVAAILLSVAAFGRLRFESDFVKNFRPGSEVRTSYRFIESNLTPVGSMEIVVRGSGGPILSPENLGRARTLGDAIVERHAPIRKAMSLADLTTLAIDSLPTSQFDLDNRLKLARSVFGPDFQRNFLNADATAMRINLRAVEGIDVDDKLALADDIDRMAAGTFGTGFSTQVTGLYYFYARLVSGLLRDQYRSFGLTLVAVFAMLVIAFRSIKTAAVAMIPNLLPVLFCLGAMGWCNIPINMTTAMMLAVTLGIAVDDTVHYLWRFRAEFARTGDYRTALEATSASVGRACVFTTVVITGGFWILMLSQFLPTAYFGGLVGFTMLGTLAADMLLLPVLIITFRVFGRPA
ncbi:MAG TPA: MMPL family transporter [Phycisphaerae bacterium]|nr:MMPL family transporter [Phycisphaerae bacterium]